MRSLLFLAALALPLESSALELDWVTIEAGGDCDVQPQGCFGAWRTPTRSPATK